MPPLLKVPEVAATLRMTPATVYSMVSLGQIGAVRVGSRTIRIPQAALEAYLKESETSPDVAHKGTIAPSKTVTNSGSVAA
jgi:excisionase family DNA binding protein